MTEKNVKEIEAEFLKKEKKLKINNAIIVVVTGLCVWYITSQHNHDSPSMTDGSGEHGQSRSSVIPEENADKSNLFVESIQKVGSVRKQIGDGLLEDSIPSGTDKNATNLSYSPVLSDEEIGNLDANVNEVASLIGIDPSLTPIVKDLSLEKALFVKQEATQLEALMNESRDVAGLIDADGNLTDTGKLAAEKINAEIQQIGIVRNQYEVAFEDKIRSLLSSEQVLSLQEYEQSIVARKGKEVIDQTRAVFESSIIDITAEQKEILARVQLETLEQNIEEKNHLGFSLQGYSSENIEDSINFRIDLNNHITTAMENFAVALNDEKAIQNIEALKLSINQ